MPDDGAEPVVIGNAIRMLGKEKYWPKARKPLEFDLQTEFPEFLPRKS